MHFGPPSVGVLARGHRVGVQDPGELDLQLDRPVLVHDPVDAVLVVCGGEDLGDDELAATGHDSGAVAEVGVLEQDARVLFVDADSVFDGHGSTSTVAKLGIQIVDNTFAVAPKPGTPVSLIPIPAVVVRDLR